MDFAADGPCDTVRDAAYDNSDNSQVLTEELVNHAGRIGARFSTARVRIPARSATPACRHIFRGNGFGRKERSHAAEILKKLEWLGIKSLISIGGDDTLSTEYVLSG